MIYFSRALCYDPSPERVLAFFKRILQLCISFSSPPFICACLILIAQVTAKSKLSSAVLGNKDKGKEIAAKFASKAQEGKKEEDDDDDDDEVYFDVLEENDEKKAAQGAKKATATTTEAVSSINGTNEYDPRKRDPRFSNAKEEELWELNLLCAHSHPSVSALARMVIDSPEDVSYEGNPIKDFSIMAFLDRFVYFFFPFFFFTPFSFFSFHNTTVIRTRKRGILKCRRIILNEKSLRNKRQSLMFFRNAISAVP
jgi:ribosome biogenesis protein MAK21